MNKVSALLMFLILLNLTITAEFTFYDRIVKKIYNALYIHRSFFVQSSLVVAVNFLNINADPFDLL